MEPKSFVLLWILVNSITENNMYIIRVFNRSLVIQLLYCDIFIFNLAKLRIDFGCNKESVGRSSNSYWGLHDPTTDMWWMLCIVLSFSNLNSALTLDRTRSQWVDLGIHTEACMTRPETCGAVGGSISLWANLIDCTFGGIISSSGSVIACNEASFRYYQCISFVREGSQTRLISLWWFQSLTIFGSYIPMLINI